MMGSAFFEIIARTAAKLPFSKNWKVSGESSFKVL